MMSKNREATELEKKKLSEMESDFVSAGFCVENIPLNLRPPKIRWGKKYRKMTDTEARPYLEKMLNALNDALDRIQTERNKLGYLVEQKEEQLIKLNQAVQANNDMLQSEVIRMNSDRQSMLSQIASLKAKIRELEKDA